MVVATTRTPSKAALSSASNAAGLNVNVNGGTVAKRITVPSPRAGPPNTHVQATITTLTEREMNLFRVLEIVWLCPWRGCGELQAGIASSGPGGDELEGD